MSIVRSFFAAAFVFAMTGCAAEAEQAREHESATSTVDEASEDPVGVASDGDGTSCAPDDPHCTSSVDTDTVSPAARKACAPDDPFCTN